MARYGSSGPVVGEAVKDGYGGEWPGEAWSYVAVMERRGVLRCDWGSSGGRGHAGCGRENCGMSIRLRFGLIRTASLGKEL